MVKILIILLTIFFAAITSADMHEEPPSYLVEDVHDYSAINIVGVPVEDSDYTELYLAFANNIFDFFAKLIRAKVDLALWIDRAIVQLVVPAVVHVTHFLNENGMTVRQVVNTVLQVMTVFAGGEAEHRVENDVPHY